MRRGERYTKEAIKDKFQRIIGRLGEDKEILKQLGMPLNEEVLRAFLVGRLNALIFDVVACLEARAVGEEERKQLIMQIFDEKRGDIERSIEEVLRG